MIGEKIVQEITAMNSIPEMGKDIQENFVGEDFIILRLINFDDSQFYSVLSLRATLMIIVTNLFATLVYISFHFYDY